MQSANLKKHPLLQQIQVSLNSVTPIANPETQNITQADANPQNNPQIRQQTLVTQLQKLLPFTPQIPHPASGNTLLRWQILGVVAGVDLTLAKWFESHLDALSILPEILAADTKHAPTLPEGIWAVWAAEGHPSPVTFKLSEKVAPSDELNPFLTVLGENWLGHNGNGQIEIGQCVGGKPWCSGANIADFGLMTYRDAEQKSQLVIVPMTAQKAATPSHPHPTIGIDNSDWHAVGMQATDTATISFNGALAYKVGSPNAYLDRVGFWHGAAGVAACWYGATARLGEYLLTSYAQKPHAFKAMYLGEISTQLSVTQQYFYYVATLIDQHPSQSHELAIRQLRAQVETTARLVLEKVGQALGAAPFCRDPHFARLAADLPVFIRQSHAAFDLQAIGELAHSHYEFAQKENLWQL